jgi:tetratricopeptide (TPR) repeat protein
MLLASADQQREQGLGWRYDGFGAYSTAEILRMLSRLSLALDEEAFKREALAAGSPTKLSEAWQSRQTATGKWQDLTTLAARELWRRLLPNERSAEILADELDELIDEAGPRAERAQQWLKAARRLIEACTSKGAPDREFFQAVIRESGSDLAGWMVEMPSTLVGTDHAAEAPALCEAFARLVDPRPVLAERAEILARLGDKAEARAQIESLLKQHPSEPVVLLKAGAVFEILGDAKKSQEYLGRYTSAMSGPSAAGRGAGKALLAPRAETAPNDKCPCGSGKKYKRCHGMPS